jgi:PIN domain nuclease of toxin-antitoxin system
VNRGGDLKLLLDTHVLIWAIDNPNLLSRRVQKALLDGANELHASEVSLWEIRLKVEAGKLAMPSDAGFIEDNFRKVGVKRYLPLELLHIHQLVKLPLIHKDSPSALRTRKVLLPDLYRARYIFHRMRR